VATSAASVRVSVIAGPMTTVAPRLKQALERAVGDADRRSRTLADPAGLLLAVVEVEGVRASRL
jgi:hypothetical protein